MCFHLRDDPKREVVNRSADWRIAVKENAIGAEDLGLIPRRSNWTQNRQ